METIVVNLFGEPSAGKSTAAMDITARLKRKGINAEYISEFAKDKLYENNGEVFKHQEYLFGKQSFKRGRVKDKVQVMVTDSPLVLSIIYNQNEYLHESFDETVMDVFNSYNNKNYMLLRNHPYENEGRFQNESEANDVRAKILSELERLGIYQNPDWLRNRMIWQMPGSTTAITNFGEGEWLTSNPDLFNK